MFLASLLTVKNHSIEEVELFTLKGSFFRLLHPQYPQTKTDHKFTGTSLFLVSKTQSARKVKQQRNITSGHLKGHSTFKTNAYPSKRIYNTLTVTPEHIATNSKNTTDI